MLSQPLQPPFHLVDAPLEFVNLRHGLVEHRPHASGTADPLMHSGNRFNAVFAPTGIVTPDSLNNPRSVLMRPVRVATHFERSRCSPWIAWWAVEGIASSMDAADIQAVYYALQQKLDVGWAVNQSIAVCLPLALFFTAWATPSRWC